MPTTDVRRPKICAAVATVSSRPPAPDPPMPPRSSSIRRVLAVVFAIAAAVFVMMYVLPRPEREHAAVDPAPAARQQEAVLAPVVTPALAADIAVALFAYSSTCTL